MDPSQTGLLWPEENRLEHGFVAQVAPILPVFRTYSFIVPKVMENSVALGQRVNIPVGRSARQSPGFIIALDQRPWDSQLRPIESLIDEQSYLTPELIALAREISNHYHAPLGITLKAMTPQSVRRRSGILRIPYMRRIDPAPENPASTRISPKRKLILQMLAANKDFVRLEDVLVVTGTRKPLIRDLIKAGLVEMELRDEESRLTDPDYPQQEPNYVLNAEQKTALDDIHQAIHAAQFSVRLLFGVSGSGKTEVYIHAMRTVIAQGKQAMLLVPEIVLTTQLISRLTTRFPKIALLHSELTDSQRSIMWRRTASGEYPVVIGTRSAVFAPCPNLGLICVDEEQETSYKNLQAPRFHVRDVAIMRARQLGIPVVLGSATPSLETWYRSDRHPDYKRLSITRRVRDLPMPKVHLVDMRDEFLERRQPVILSRLMENALKETIEQGEQAIVLMNRRGFANRLYCPACKSRITCPRCNVGLVVHTATMQSLCHYCHQRFPTPQTCPNITCKTRLTYVGQGTQRVEQILADLLPHARIRRVDSDTMRRRAHYQELIDDFEQRRLDILIGTQMIAKGLDFPNVSLVCVIAAEAVGLASDFRAQERLFQLITQVSGRAGRADRPGRAILQTITPELPALNFALEHDWEGFAKSELTSRAKVGWPPFRRLARVVVSHPREEIARNQAAHLADAINAVITSLALENAGLLGPDSCAIARARGRYRYELLIRTAGAKDLQKLLDHLESIAAFRLKSARLTLDVDPVDLM